MECLNLGVVVLVALLGIHSLVVCSRALYGSNLYLELVWLLAPTSVVVLLIVRTVGMQCSDEELGTIPSGYVCTGVSTDMMYYVLLAFLQVYTIL